MKLSQMGYKRIRCVLYEQDGKVVRNHTNPEKIIETGKDVVIVYNPTQEQEQHILTIMEESRDENNIQVGGLKVLNLMVLLTNIDLENLTDEEAVQIIENPSELLQAINLELNTIMLNVLKNQFQVVQEMTQLPEAIRKPIIDQATEKARQEQEELERARLEEIEELERMAELEKQLEELKQKRGTK